MSALADALRALMPLAGYPEAPKGSYTTFDAARDVLRKHAPCKHCKGDGCFYEEYDERFKSACSRCFSAGWTPESVDAAIKREEVRERLDKSVLDAADAWHAADFGTGGQGQDEALDQAVKNRRLGPK